MKIKRADLRAMSTAEPAETAKTAEAAGQNGNAFAAFLGALHGTDRISRSTALNIPALAGGVEFITTQAAAVPFRLYRQTDKGLEEVREDDRARVLNLDAGDLLSNNELLAGLYRDYLLEGNGYLYINRRRNRVESLHYVDAEQVAVTVDPDPIFKTGHIHVYGKSYRPWDFVRLCRHSTDGMHGTGILQENSKMLALAWATLVLQNSIMRGGGNARGYVTSERGLSKPQIDELKKGFASLYSAEGNGVVVLNKGLDFHQSSNTAVEMQLQEIVQQNRQEILLILGVPYEVLNGRGTEDQFNAAVQRAVVPIITAMETALNRDLLLEREKGALVWRADTTELTKGAIKQRYEAYKLATEGGWISKNEIRSRESLPTVDGLDVVGMNLADVLFDMNTGKYYTPNTGSVVGADGQEAPQEPQKNDPQPLPGGDDDAILEERGRDYKRDDKGRFAYDGGRKKEPAKERKKKPYSKPAIKLSKKEYGKVMHEISTAYYEKYDGKSIGYLQLLVNNVYYRYKFEIKGFNDYKIIGKRKI